VNRTNRRTVVTLVLIAVFVIVVVIILFGSVSAPSDP
jgi:hypothetical protein